MSTTAFQIIQLVKSLPPVEQQLICAALNRQTTSLAKIKRLKFSRTPDGGYCNPDGIPDDDPFFKIMEDIEAARR